MSSPPPHILVIFQTEISQLLYLKLVERDMLEVQGQESPRSTGLGLLAMTSHRQRHYNLLQEIELHVSSFVFQSYLVTVSKDVTILKIDLFE